MHAAVDAIHALSKGIRYVALYQGGSLASSVKSGVKTQSSAESDRYEELIVNPTLVKLLSQRGNIDCGGLEYVLVRYGSFFALVCPIPGGHVSITLDPSIDPLPFVPANQAIVARTCKAA